MAFTSKNYNKRPERFLILLDAISGRNPAIIGFKAIS
jgi:hypothetical protein